MSIKRMVDLDLAGKRVLIRQDLNVPVKDGKVTSDLRIQASVPTVEAALAGGAAFVCVCFTRGSTWVLPTTAHESTSTPPDAVIT